MLLTFHKGIYISFLNNLFNHKTDFQNSFAKFDFKNDIEFFPFRWLMSKENGGNYQEYKFDVQYHTFTVIISEMLLKLV